MLRRHSKAHYKKDYTLLRSIPGIGPIVASGILSELGDLRRFQQHQASGRLCGACPGHLPKWRHHATHGSEHAGAPIDTQLFCRGLLAGDTDGPGDAGLLSQASGQERKTCHRQSGQ